jgi:hypothetical protein
MEARKLLIPCLFYALVSMAAAAYWLLPLSWRDLLALILAGLSGGVLMSAVDVYQLTRPDR